MQSVANTECEFKLSGLKMIFGSMSLKHHLHTGDQGTIHLGVFSFKILSQEAIAFRMSLYRC